MRERGKRATKLLSSTTLVRARTLRCESTDVEHKLWILLHSRQLRGAKFRRQHPIGRYFADFCCVKSRLIVELDGEQHAERQEVEHDRERSAYLRSLGYRVIRFWNDEVVEDPEWVLDQIYYALIAENGEAEPSPARHESCENDRKTRAASPSPATKRARGGKRKESGEGVPTPDRRN
jgi:very-short-patch-repair endonuclease